jgi:hypothetical protein
MQLKLWLSVGKGLIAKVEDYSSIRIVVTTQSVNETMKWRETTQTE